ncbi:hypothetical protein BDZ88DRAFT_418649 [Geranomyces variabilis]|nr:hypothetical protein BDZ88DRAFT_418649 [Geranomyces variabilis]KAJ3133373.1 hypothetical protein HDU90_006322 [Geranomyces variabilis]
MSSSPAPSDLLTIRPVEVIDLDSDSDDVQARTVQASAEVIDLTMLPASNADQELRFNAITGLVPVQFVKPGSFRSPSPPPRPLQGPAGPSAAELYHSLIMPELNSKPVIRTRATLHRDSPDVIVIDSDSDDCGDARGIPPRVSTNTLGNDHIFIGLNYEQNAARTVGNASSTDHATLDLATPHMQHGRARRCDICEIDLPSDQTYAAHNSSIGHLHARSALADALAPAPAPTPISSSVSPESIGLRLLKMSGWTPGTGLGAENQGRVAPIDVHYKNDMKGLGAPTRKIKVGGAGQGPMPGVDPAHDLRRPTKEQAASIKVREAARLANERERQQILAYLKS